MKIFSGTSSKELTDNICKILNKYNAWDNISPSKLRIENFSDGEILPSFGESVRHEEIFIVQSLSSADLIMETLLIIDAAKRAGCPSITLIAPYISYSRQDKTDHLRSSIGAKLMADMLEKAGINKLMTIDLHASTIQGFYNVPVIHLNGNKIFTEYIKKHNIENLTIVAPDSGAAKRAGDFCKAFPDATFAQINKKRIKPNVVHSMELVGDVKGRNVVIVDDMADTLGTLRKAADLIIANGANSVRGISTHPILSGPAYTNLDDSVLTELLVSDTIKSQPSNKIKVISSAEIIANALWSLTNKKSVNEINLI